MENNPSYLVSSKGDEVIIQFDEYDDKDLFWDWLSYFGLDLFDEYKKSKQRGESDV